MKFQNALEKKNTKLTMVVTHTESQRRRDDRRRRAMV
jgi:hypothetical protein